MDSVKALNVFVSDAMPANWTHCLPTDPDRDVKGNSFTRDKSLKWGDMPIRLTVDQTRLAYTNKIIPVDGHYVHRFTRGNFDWENINSRAKSGKNANPSEEFVVGVIKAIHRSIVQIELVSFRHTERDAVLLDVVQAYGQKWKISVIINPSVFIDFEDYKIRLQNLQVTQKHNTHPDIRKWFPEYRPNQHGSVTKTNTDLMSDGARLDNV